MYSPLARVFTGYFNLDSNDLRTLSFDDVIFIQNAYYRVLKVYDAPITDIQTVKVDLVKILDTVTFANGGDPDPAGGGIDDIVAVGSGGSQIDPPPPPPPTDYYFVASDCDGVLSNIVVKANTNYSIGTVVNVSGSGYVGTCWTLVDYSVAPEDATVLDAFASCAECQSL